MFLGLNQHIKQGKNVSCKLMLAIITAQYFIYTATSLWISFLGTVNLAANFNIIISYSGSECIYGFFASRVL